MNKSEFLNDLKCKLNFLSEEERVKTLNYYSEIIDDRIESGMSEEEATSQMESTRTIAEKLMPEGIPQRTTVEKVFDFIDTLLTKHGYLFMLAIIVFSFPIWSPIAVGILTFVGIVFLILFGLIALGGIGSVIALGIAVSFITQSLLSTFSALGVSMICVGFTMLITIGTAKLIGKMSSFCKNTYQSIKERSEKRRNSKWVMIK